KLAFWTGRDAVRMELLFSASTLGQRRKWRERPDYRQRTIGAAIASCATVYSASSNWGGHLSLHMDACEQPSPPLSQGESSLFGWVDRPRAWGSRPNPFAKKVFYGPAGDFARLVDPHSKPAPAAILIQFLVAMGNTRLPPGWR